jgi:2'-5' RNA ligase
MRTFIELAMPDAAREYIRQRQDHVCRLLVGQGAADCFRWTQISSVHLTLRFLGDTTEDQQRRLAHGLADMATDWPAIPLSIGGLGGFPSVRKPRVLWLGIGGDLDGLHRLQAAVERLAQACGFEPEDRPYSPHLTIARTRRNCSRSSLQEAGKVLSQFRAEDTVHSAEGRFDSATLIHTRSDLQTSGAVYSPLSTHLLSR